jgi:hypothetical protein
MRVECEDYWPMIGVSEVTQSSSCVFGENITEKGDVQNIWTQCGYVRIKCGVTGGRR